MAASKAPPLPAQRPQQPARDIDVEACLTSGATRVIKVRASTNALGIYLAAHRLHQEESEEVTHMRILP